jgi:hypothetical protein
MSNNDPQRDEDKMDEFRRSLTTHNTKAPEPDQEPGTFDRFKAALGDAGERSTSWVSARVKDTLQDFVGRVLYGEISSPEPSDKYQELEREKGGMDR